MNTMYFGPNHTWDNLQQFLKASDAVENKTPGQMVRDFRVAFDQPVDQTPVDLDDPEDISSWMRVEEEWNEADLAWVDEDTGGPEELLKEMCDVLYTIYGYAAFRGWNIDEAFKRVHLSNLSKLNPDGTYTKDASGKVLKGPQYQKPYLRDLV